MSKKTDAKAAVRRRLLEPYASKLEHCSTVLDGVTVMEQMLEVVRSAAEPLRLDDYVGLFSDWLGEVIVHDDIDARTRVRAMAIVDALTAASTEPPLREDLTRIRQSLAATRAR